MKNNANNENPLAASNPAEQVNIPITDKIAVTGLLVFRIIIPSIIDIITNSVSINKFFNPIY